MTKIEFLRENTTFAVDLANPYDVKILECLEKQTPKAPKVEKYFYGKYYLCPSCGQRVNEGECCRNNECGQLINWRNV